MDPFKLFWKTVGGLENLLGVEAFAMDWFHGKGEFRIGGVNFEMVAGDDPKTVNVVNLESGETYYVNAAVEPLMIADVLEFILKGLLP